MHLHWHRRDLRLTDNRGLAAAEGVGETVAVFVLDPGVLVHAGPPRVAFLLDALESLRADYQERGSDLLLARGDPREVLPALAEEYGVSTVTWCRDYSGLARDRDAAVRRALADVDVDRVAVHDAVHHGTTEPTVPTLADLGFDKSEATVPSAGTAAARERLGSFCESDIYRYDERRDYPADNCCSRLSAHLKYGTIGVREVYEETEAAKMEASDETERESVFEFQDQLAWREFYAQVLWDRPDVVTDNYKQYEQPIAWREDPEGLQAWKDGETGYPIVDAGMRQLREEAYMHNRVRMIVASFLTKDLLIDWRRGYEWFRKKLVDHDTANDNGGWQWAASTGTDAQPYFRIFNPVTQGERYDPDAEYITRYVPELASVPADTIHSWHDLDDGTRQMHAPEYSTPIVDHSKRREMALETFQRARGEAD
ncbi:deoxyribodipyrimidine photo-lyase [Halobacteriales archaeon QH_10_65_19]|nr:MAG: deoxyribodipyrimidine photo-lyase [Halobacteriales archaeon QH_10_65_19]